MSPRPDDQAIPELPLLPATLRPSTLLTWIVRLRWLFFAFLALLLLATYNGQWRAGRDSALYRAVAQNLASGKGYTFRGEPERQIYPGLPLLLAGIDKIAGPQDPLRPRAALLTMLALAGLTLIVLYHLVKAYYPPWVAVCVTTGVGINCEFLKATVGLMTDLPFLLGVLLTLLGVAWLRTRKRWSGLALLLLGAVLAISMRPTFWALAIAGVLACLTGLLRSRHRAWYAGGMLLVVFLVLVWWNLDPRVSGRSLLAGQYEKSAVNHIKNFISISWTDRLHRTFDGHLPDALFGFELLPVMGTVLLVCFVAASILQTRRALLWGLFTLVTLAMLLVIGSTPRYFLMILPLLLVQWAAGVWWLAQHAGRWRQGLEVMLLLGLSVATLGNLVHAANLVLEQHGFTRRLAHKGFLNVYEDGKMRPLIAASNALRTHVAPSEKVLGPEERILTFLSGRSVWGMQLPRENRPGTWERKMPPTERKIVAVKKRQAWRNMMQQRNFKWCIYGPALTKGSGVGRLIRWKYIAPIRETEIRTEGVILARFTYPLDPRVPKAKLRKTPTTRPAPGR